MNAALRTEGAREASNFFSFTLLLLKTSLTSVTLSQAQRLSGVGE